MRERKFAQALEVVEGMHDPANPQLQTLTLLGVLYGHLKQKEEAEKAFVEALRVSSDNPQAYENLLTFYHHENRHSDVIRVATEALDKGPHQGAAEVLLSSLFAIGEPETAWERAQQLMQEYPRSRKIARVAVMLTLYSSEVSEAQARNAHDSYARSIESHFQPNAHFFNSRHPDRKLKLGIMSIGLNANVVSFFLLPILQHLDEREFEVTLYNMSHQIDRVTDRLKDLAMRHRDLGGLTPDSVCDQIRADKIDVLLDIDEIAAQNNCVVISQRPAPVQLEYLGYPISSGLSRVQGRIVDAIADPEVDPRLLKLPGCFLCYDPMDDLPPIEPLPDRDPVFGSFNNSLKVSRATLDSWITLLKRVPNAKLVLKYRGYEYDTTKKRIVSYFEREGVNADRIEFIGYRAGSAPHLTAYQEIDVALDTFPYNGTTTTFEALSMGVPVVTVTGNAHRSRVGTSILTNLGRKEWIGKTIEEYVEIAAHLAQDRDQLKLLRLSLRDQLLASNLCDGEVFVQGFQHAIRQEWRSWCEVGH